VKVFGEWWSIKKRWKDLLYISLGLFLIAVLMLRADVTDTLDVMSGIDIRPLILVLVLYLLNTGCKVLRWYGLLKGMKGKRLGPIILPIFLSSLALNNSTPGKIGGEPVRGLMLKEHTGNRLSLGIATIFAEKSLDILTILGFAIFGMIYLMIVLGFEDIKGMAFAIILGGLLITVLILLILSRRSVRLVTGMTKRIILKTTHGNRSSRLFKLTVSANRFMERFHRSLRSLGKGPSVGTGVVILTIVIWINEALRLYIILQALPGNHSITFPGAVAAIAVANVLGFILPIGSGNVIGSASVLEVLSGNEPMATAASIIQVATSLWISIPLGVISLFFLRSRKEKFISNDID